MGVGQDIQNFQFQQKTKNVKILTSPIGLTPINILDYPNRITKSYQRYSNKFRKIFLENKQ